VSTAEVQAESAREPCLGEQRRKGSPASGPPGAAGELPRVERVIAGTAEQWCAAVAACNHGDRLRRE